MTEPSLHERLGSRVLAAGGLGLVFVFALVIRALDAASVFPGDGTVVIALADASYHARRALYSFANFPAVLWFDPQLNFPDGSPVPWPPGFDWLLAAVGRMLTSTEAGFERVLAWASPVLGALTVVPVAAAARALGGTGLALGAGALFALLPVAALPSRIGNPDHHAAVALLGAALLAVALRLVRPAAERRHLLALSMAWAGLWAALVVTWSGSLLYLMIGQGLIGLAGVLRADRWLLRTQAAGAVFAALVAAVFVWASGTPLGGPVSSLTLSWLHVGTLLVVAWVAWGVTWLEAWRPAAGWLSRLLRAGALCALPLVGLAALPDLREALEPGVAFLTKQDDWAQRSMEGQGLFEGRRERALLAGPRPAAKYGGFAYLLPLVCLAGWARARTPSLRGPALVFAAWGTVFGVLAVGEIRFGADFAPAASIGFALLLDEARSFAVRRWPSRRRLAAVVVVLAGLAMLWTPIFDVYLPQARRTVVRLSGVVGHPRGGHAAKDSLDVFLREVRRVTPDPGGFEDASVRPSYGIVTRPGLGHAVRWRARRPVSADPFGPYLHDGRLDHVYRTLGAPSEAEALALIRELGGRYFLTAAHYALGRYAFERRLHLEDGLATAESEPLHHFRLVTEGPVGGRPYYPIPYLAGGAAYKLFEVVEGAVLEVEVPPGTPVEAEIDLLTPLGRRLRWKAVDHADAAGVVRIRVPYPSVGSSAPVRSIGPWRLRAAGRMLRARVSEADVREGRVIPVRDRGRP